MERDNEGSMKPLYLRRAMDTHIRRHIKVKAEANPFDPRFKKYYEEREKNKRNGLRSTLAATTAGLRTQSAL